ncbi:LEA type 2 family protein [candidate division KSB1 bacterium]|nr:LEA type 2 family protein [candidate division KSB1 bacterium]NIR69530.1 LEA type 2 family protein [candidate division KSB1 bacterium]NIS24298.1 LEA type 2 family protein [candidate division KSB1 bacterium]NIT71213.1 LEA type 2 family protein [candidate division KSB1 bacterium]NIU24917.1 LEA type 2 family protein [candidate division KSB1 bacterium]
MSKSWLIPHLFLLGLINLVIACGSVGEMVKNTFKKPTVSFGNPKLHKLSFESITLLFDLKITNPNPLAIKLAGLDYDFLLNEQSFVTGNQEHGLEILSESESTVEIPVTFNFSDVYQTFKSLKNRDSTQYELRCGLSFDLPLLGRKRVPVSKSGSLPLLKLPNLRVESLNIESLGLTGTDLTLNVQLENPNTFAFVLQKMDYGLKINNKEWVTSSLNRDTEIAANDAGLISIPISLNFLQIGQSAYQLLKDSRPLDYHFEGELDLSSSIPLLKQVTLPFERSGQVSLVR